MQPHKSHLSHSVKSWYSSIQCASTAAPFNVTNEWSLFDGGASSWAEDPFLTPFPVDFRDKRAARERGINDFFCELMICLIQMDYSHTHTLVRTFLGLDRFASIPLRFYRSAHHHGPRMILPWISKIHHCSAVLHACSWLNGFSFSCSCPTTLDRVQPKSRFISHSY